MYKREITLYIKKFTLYNTEFGETPDVHKSVMSVNDIRGKKSKE